MLKFAILILPIYGNLATELNLIYPVQSLEAQEFPLNTGMYALLIDMYVKTENLEKARETLAAMVQRHPDARLTPTKVFRLAQLMVQQGLINGLYFMCFKWCYVYMYRNVINFGIHSRICNNNTTNFKFLSCH